jgi:hypothetical protein
VCSSDLFASKSLQSWEVLNLVICEFEPRFVLSHNEKSFLGLSTVIFDISHILHFSAICTRPPKISKNNFHHIFSRTQFSNPPEFYGCSFAADISHARKEDMAVSGTLLSAKRDVDTVKWRGLASQDWSTFRFWCFATMRTESPEEIHNNGITETYTIELRIRIRPFSNQESINSLRNSKILDLLKINHSSSYVKVCLTLFFLSSRKVSSRFSQVSTRVCRNAGFRA